MATFTVPLWRAIDLSRDKGVGLDDYPIFDEEYRAGLNRKIIDHYWNHEIGQETIDMFRMALGRRMREIMPYWNQMYESQKLTIDPLNTISIRSVSMGENENDTKIDGETVQESITDSKGRSINQSFPQTQLAGNKDYAESGADTRQRGAVKAEGSENTSTTAKGTDRNESETTGYQGSQAMLLLQLRATFLNIDMEIIDQLPDVFMSVWNNGDFYTPNNRIGYQF